MPVSLTYPGVYVEEIASGVRSITGVATSITAFVGRAQRGPTDADGPYVVDSYPDFVRTFGGLWAASPMTYAVRDFFANGGSQAIIVRIFSPDGANATNATLALPLDGGGDYTLTARYPGSWGNNLQALVDWDTSDSTVKAPLVPDPHLFNLYVRDSGTGQVESFRNVSTDPTNPRRVDKVLSNTSILVTGDALVSPAIARPAAVVAPKGWNDPAILVVATADQVLDGLALLDATVASDTLLAAKRGMYALEKSDLFNLLCIPPYSYDTFPATGVSAALVATAAEYCEARRAVLVVDPPVAWSSESTATVKATAVTAAADLAASVGSVSSNAALYFPWLSQPDPLRDNQTELFAPCGAVAGIMARTDAQRGVWKAPAGLDASLVGVPALDISLTDNENGELNPLGVNCLRVMPAAGPVVWGARTMAGNDRLASDWKYVSVRRTALFLEESLYRGTQWVVFEPNDEPLWAQIRLDVGSFMHDMFRQGAFQGQTPTDAYFVKCDKESTTQSDINSGIVNIVVGFAPLKPAEFVVIQLQQMAGTDAT
jgi:Bacteriophage tail sheath protein